MSISVTQTKSSNGSKDNGSKIFTEMNEDDDFGNGGSVSESFFLGEVTTVPLMILEGEMQQREIHKPGLSMGPMNIMDEENPEIIKRYLCGFLELPSNLPNVGYAFNGIESLCIDLKRINSLKNNGGNSNNGTWCVSEVAVRPPKIVFGNGKEKKSETAQEESTESYEPMTNTEAVDKLCSSMDQILDEFSIELEKRIKENGYDEGVMLDEKHLARTGFWSPKEKSKGKQKGEHKGSVEETELEVDLEIDEEPKGNVEETDFEDDLETEEGQESELPPPVSEPEASFQEEDVSVVKGQEGTEEPDQESAEPEDMDESESEVLEDEPELEDTINGILDLMVELDNEKRGTEEERAKLREMVKDIEEKREDLGKDPSRTEDDEIELKGIISAVEDRMNDLKMEKMDNDMQKAEVEGMIAGMEDKMTEFELSQIGSEAEKTELKRMMDGIEGKISEIEDGGIETEVARAELEGMIAGIEDKMTELELSQIGSDAEKSQLQRMMDELEKKISEMDDEKKEKEGAKSEMEDKLKGMEEKMTQMESELEGTKERMEELKNEVEVKRFTMEYIQNLEDRPELEVLCCEVGLSAEGSDIELKERLLNYVEGMEEDDVKKGEVEDQRFTKENIESIKTKAELVALCGEAGLKKSGKKEEVRERLLEYARSLEKEKPKMSQGTKPQLRMEGTDKLVYAVLGDMYKHLSLELGDSVSDHVNDLEGFIRSVLEVREEMGMESNDTLRTVVIKPDHDKTTEILNKLKTPFLNKVKAENLVVVEPDKEWEGIKLEMEIDRELIAAKFKSQATKIQMLLKLQSPQKIKKILEEKGDYTLGVEGYPITIAPEMLKFRVVNPDNFSIRRVERGIVYIENDFVKHVEPEEELPPPPDDEEIVREEEEPTEDIPEPEEPSEEMEEHEESQETERVLPPPPQKFKKTKSSDKKKGGFLGRLKRKKRRKKSS
jgi:hypothetical protein